MDFIKKRTVIEKQVAKWRAGQALRDHFEKEDLIKAGSEFQPIFQKCKGDNLWSSGEGALSEEEQWIIFDKIADAEMEKLAGEDRPIIRRRQLDKLKKVYSEHATIDFRTSWEKASAILQELKDHDGNTFRKASELDRVSAWNEFVNEMEDAMEKKTDMPGQNYRECREARDGFTALLKSREASGKLKKTWEVEKKQIENTDEYKRLDKIQYGSTCQTLFNKIRGIMPRDPSPPKLAPPQPKQNKRRSSDDDIVMTDSRPRKSRSRSPRPPNETISVLTPRQQNRGMSRSVSESVEID